MQNLMSFVPALVLLLLCAAYFKLAGLIFQRFVIRWSHGFIYATVIGVVVLLTQMALKNASESFPAATAGALAICIAVPIGGTMLGMMVKTKNEQPLGIARGMTLSVVTMSLLLLTVAMVALLLGVARNVN